MPMAISSPGTNRSSPRRQYSSTPSNPVGKSSAKSDVPTAVLGARFPITIRAGTITSPPPMPNIPLKTPAQPPSKSIQAISVQSIDGSLLTPGQDRRGPGQSRGLDAQDMGAQANGMPASSQGQIFFSGAEPALGSDGKNRIEPPVKPRPAAGRRAAGPGQETHRLACRPHQVDPAQGRIQNHQSITSRLLRCFDDCPSQALEPRATRIDDRVFG